MYDLDIYREMTPYLCTSSVFSHFPSASLPPAFLPAPTHALLHPFTIPNFLRLAACCARVATVVPGLDPIA